MPTNKVINHPDGKTVITFNEEDHSYVDNFGKTYRSVTTIIDNSFPKFDAETIAQRCAEKQGISKDELIAQWNEKGRQARYYGTRLHENCEHQILDQEDKLHIPSNMDEAIRFNAAYEKVSKLKSLFLKENLYPEYLIFSPTFGIAGTADLLAIKNENEAYIFDWKVLSKDLQKESFNCECGSILPTLNIQNTNYWHYAIQLQLYEYLLKIEGYLKQTCKVTRILMVWNGVEFKKEIMPNIPEAWGILAYFKK
jgi:hypothetical protein